MNPLNIQLTESLKQYLWKFHRTDLPLVLFGHLEVLDPYWDDYISWCKTDEGLQYMKSNDSQ